ncbi:MAG: hypothetical protein H7A30_04205 [Thermotogae bacterium]|nr:hypothetical protein [Thermotogota bacterium]
MLNYVYPKKILRKSDFPDTYFVSKYGLSPYMACSHACSYCDGRSEKYHVDGNFDTDIKVRKNIAEILEKELSQEREKGLIMIMSGISDPYQHAENNEKLMPEIYKKIEKYGFSCSVTTKSSMIKRDYEYLGRINRKSGCNIFMSLTFHEDKYRKIFEPLSSGYAARVSVLKHFHENGFCTGVLAMPFIPYINDSSEDIYKLLSELKKFTDVVIPGGMTLRPGINKEYFMKFIKENFPELTEKYIKLYSQNRQSGSGDSKYFDDFYGRFYAIARELRINTIIPHYMYKNKFLIYDEIYILLSHLYKILKYNNYGYSTVKKAFNSYCIWLGNEKNFLKKNKKLTGKDLENKLLFEMKNGNMKEIFNSEKLYDLLYRVLFENFTVSYDDYIK